MFLEIPTLFQYTFGSFWHFPTWFFEKNTGLKINKMEWRVILNMIINTGQIKSIEQLINIKEPEHYNCKCLSYHKKRDRRN